MAGSRESGFVTLALGSSSATRTGSLVDLQVRNNDRSAGLWDLYAGHRSSLTRLVVGQGRGGRALVLGAGNANDLDLGVLARAFDEVHLADLDAAALRRAVRRQDVATRTRLVVHPGRDLSGLLDRLPSWRAEAPDLETLARAAPLAGARVAAQLGGPFDVVVSDCFLSQVAWTCFTALGDGALLMNVLDVALAAHLRALVALARPGGRCVLATDVVSSESQPLERLLAELDGEALLARLEARRELFSGTSPALARLMLAQDPALARHVEDVRLAAPWLWRVSRSRTVLVYALTFERRR
ncbi:MAG TPA: hypothetical protein VHL80_20905 [Polyangia bacterium]|nr:hypothetical protein [Polyangia bacterium]